MLTPRGSRPHKHYPDISLTCFIFLLCRLWTRTQPGFPKSRQNPGSPAQERLGLSPHPQFSQGLARPLLTQAVWFPVRPSGGKKKKKSDLQLPLQTRDPLGDSQAGHTPQASQPGPATSQSANTGMHLITKGNS